MRMSIYYTTQVYSDVMIKANDTDIVVEAISARHHLQETGVQKMWDAFGQGAHLR